MVNAGKVKLAKIAVATRILAILFTAPELLRELFAAIMFDGTFAASQVSLTVMPHPATVLDHSAIVRSTAPTFSNTRQSRQRAGWEISMFSTQVSARTAVSFLGAPIVSKS